MDIIYFLMWANRPAGFTYYVDATLGLDTNSGLTQALPWQTIAKVNAATLLNGDSVLFRRGERWRENLILSYSGISGRPITFGAYGTGNKPIIDGTDVIAGWALDSGAIYKVTVAVGYEHTQIHQQTFVDGETRLARKTSKGAMAAGSFYWDGPNDILYVWLTDSSDPAGHTIEFSRSFHAAPQRQETVNLAGYSYLVFDGLKIYRACLDGLCDVTGTSHDVTVKNCEISWCSRSGINFNAPFLDTDGTNRVNNVIRNNIIHDVLSQGIWVGSGSYLIEDNEVYNCRKDSALGYTTGIVDGSGVIIGSGAFNTIFRRNYIHDPGTNWFFMTEYQIPAYGHNAVQPVNCQIYNNRFVRNNAAAGGLDIELGGNGDLFYNNIVHVQLGSAIQIGQTGGAGGAPTGVKVYHNTVIGEDIAGVYMLNIWASSNGEVKNNIFRRTSASNKYQINLRNEAVTGYRFAANDFYTYGNAGWIYKATNCNTYAAWVAALAADGAANNVDANNSIVTDPVMVADTTAEPNTNMHLQVTSPCRNIGVTGLGITTDYDGIPWGATPDIGAYKYV